MLYGIRDIAKWPNEQVSVPVLQRGLVWNPKQIELFWDSIMRGIPVGSFVICKNVENQHRRSTDHSKCHLLDGQQRANAISLGFANYNDPQNPKKSILWLDINPETLPKDSSRNFLFRITTQAHPWGYNKSDNEGYLSASTIRTFLKEKYRIDVTKNYKRPDPKDLCPIEANCPVPVSILISAFDGKNINKSRLIGEIEKYSGFWRENALKTLNNEFFDLSQIEHGLNNALNCKILALETPDELLKASSQEGNSDESQENITNIEHLFQRLNQQGTRLDGEELIYSLIKAYWPDIADAIDDLAKDRMPCSRLINLAFRVVISEENKSLANAMSVSAIRRLAKDDKETGLREKIINFINCDLGKCCEKVDAILGVNPQCDWGLPPVLYSEIARNNAELYLLLLLCANKYQNIDEETCCRLTGIITYASWFGKDQTAIAKKVYEKIQNEKDLTEDNLCNIIKTEEFQNLFCKIQAPKALNDFIDLPNSNEELSSWRWWSLIADQDENKQNEKQSQWRDVICRIKSNKNLLLYAQRQFICERFPDYDPSRKDLWGEHNRPWDYDHILPYYYTYNKKSNNQFLKFCKEWCNTIGNFRAWPAEDNRSDQKDLAAEKITDEKLLQNSFIIPEEMDGFNNSDIISNSAAAKEFAIACKSRILRIYREWFKSLKIGDLLDNKTSSEQNVF